MSDGFCCNSCRTGRACEGCATPAPVSRASSGFRDPYSRAARSSLTRTSTGRASGVGETPAPDTIYGMPRATFAGLSREAQEQHIRNNAPPDQVAPTLQAFGRGGLDALSTHLRETQQTRRQEIQSNATTQQEQIRANAAVQQAEIRARVELERARMGLPPLADPAVSQYPGSAPPPTMTTTPPATPETFWQKHGDTVLTVGALGGVAALLYFVTRPPPPPPPPPPYDDPRYADPQYDDRGRR